MSYLGIGSFSSIVHVLARLPFVARAAVLCAAIVLLRR